MISKVERRTLFSYVDQQEHRLGRGSSMQLRSQREIEERIETGQALARELQPLRGSGLVELVEDEVARLRSELDIRGAGLNHDHHHQS
jgi:hypothetical protein